MDHVAPQTPYLSPTCVRCSFENAAIVPGASIHVGQYLFTGAETSSAYLTVQQVRAARAPSAAPPPQQAQTLARACC